MIKKILRILIPNQYHQHMRLIYNYFNSMRYRGSNYYCPICKYSSRVFLAYSKNMPNALCPRCNSHARHRLLWLYLNNQCADLLSQKIDLLHFAPEHFFLKKFQALPNINYLSVDLNSPLAMMKVDITKMPYPDNAFDLVLCSHVLEHVEADRQAMSELYRVLKPNGLAIIQVPVNYTNEKTLEDPNITSPEDRLHFYGERDHLRLYGRDFAQRLEAVDFKVTEDGYVQTLEGTYSKQCGLDLNEKLYVCTKK